MYIKYQGKQMKRTHWKPMQLLKWMVTFLDIFDNLLNWYEFLEQKEIYLDENNNFKIYVISCMKGHINKKYILLDTFTTT